MYTYIHVCMYIRIYMYIYLCVYMHMYVLCICRYWWSKLWGVFFFQKNLVSKPLLETWFCSSLGVPIPDLARPPQHQQYSCQHFRFDPYGDHLQTCQHQSAALPTHDWVVYRLILMLQDHTSSRKRTRRHRGQGLRCLTPRMRLRQLKEWCQAFWGVLIDLIIGFLGLITKAFENQTDGYTPKTGEKVVLCCT